MHACTAQFLRDSQRVLFAKNVSLKCLPIKLILSTTHDLERWNISIS